jgi:hypothetical protein
LGKSTADEPVLFGMEMTAVSETEIPAELVGKESAAEPWMIELYSDAPRVAKLKSQSWADVITMGQLFRMVAIDPELSVTTVYERVHAVWSTIALLATLTLAFAVTALFVGHDINFADVTLKTYFGVAGAVSVFCGLISIVSAATSIMLFTVVLQDWKRQYLLNFAYLSLFPLHMFIISLVAFAVMCLVYIREAFDATIYYFSVALCSIFVGIFAGIFCVVACNWQTIVGTHRHEKTA